MMFSRQRDLSSVNDITKRKAGKRESRATRRPYPAYQNVVGVCALTIRQTRAEVLLKLWGIPVLMA
ncbi:Uncharacterised protein [Serratia grimesii]|nr:Uncharacterised protein [Serratia grimesii]CAI2406569.1 Uncharacterised protein [Serratia grimesii]CAI2788793.1 Uncharacterised protein [Serratia grimesii]CUW22438.1 Uncharacterised protein [Serratia grimesii]SMZ57615.1 Uncharacterised protein [Serratia grimesii]